MAIDPFAGQEVYSGGSFTGSMLTNAADMAGVESPLVARMASHIPGFATSALFSNKRGAQTLMRGGFMDNGGTGRLRGGLANRRMNRYRIVDPNTGLMSSRRPGQFVGGDSRRRGLGRLFGARDDYFTRRADRLMAKPSSAGFVKSSRLNNLTMRPRAFSRFHSVSVFGQGAYTPFGAAGIIGRSSFVKEAFEKVGINAADGESVLAGGFFSYMGAMDKSAALERKIAKRGGVATARQQRKLARLDRNIRALSSVNNPGILAGKTVTSGIPGLTGYDSASKLGYTRSKIVSMGYSGFDEFIAANKATSVTIAGADDLLARTGADFAAGVRGNLLASSARTEGLQYLLGYSQGVKGFGGAEGLFGKAKAGAEAAESAFKSAVTNMQGGLKTKKGLLTTADEAQDFLRKTSVDNRFFRSLGLQGTKQLAQQGGGKIVALRAASSALKVLNPLGTVMMAATLGAMAGEVVKSGVILARDAQKSMKGSISKPLFGMGYRDTEAAATSRARGVMAIQNSQLNARSALGNEAGMMAAHFG